MKNRTTKLLLDAFDTRWHRYEQLQKACASEPTETNIHDLRTSIRRLLAILLLIGAISKGPSKARTRLRKHLKRQLDQFDETRDLAVAQKLALALSSREPALNDVAAWLAVQQQHALDQAQQHHAAAARRRFRKTRRRLARRKDKLPAALQTALSRYQAEFVARLQVARADAPETLHPARITLKRLRYIAEFLAPASGLPDADRMADVQTRMGNVQDLCVLAAFVADYGKQHPAIDVTEVSGFLQAESREAARTALKAAHDLLTI